MRLARGKENMRILLLDIETAPNKAYIWQLWQEVTSCDMIENHWYILCWSAKWLDDKKIYKSALPDFQGYKKNPEDDKEVLLKLWELLDKADIVIAHNGINFDRKKINTRFVINDLNPPSPYRMIDTLEVARKEFSFTSNKLADLAKFLHIGKKLETGGFQLWKDCLAGISSAWTKMVNYCVNDIVLLEKVYLRLRPYILQHPNMGVSIDKPGCPKCGSGSIVFRGYKYTNAGKYKQFCCVKCGGWGRLKINELTKEQRAVLTTNA